MKDTRFISKNPIIMKEETVMDVIKDIIKEPEREEPFFVLDVGDIVKKVKVWKLKLPRVEMFYAVKCNDNVTVLETLASLGTGFDCASKSEMNKVLDLGVDPSRIIYAHPCKPISHLRQAIKFNVPLMTFDNLSELLKIKEVYPHAKLVIRIRCDAAKAQCDLGMKFGVLPEDALPLLEAAWDLGLDIVGVSFHVGSGCQEPQVFKRAISAARDIFDQAIKIGFTPNLLDIGGGYPGVKGTNLDELADIINKSLDAHFPVSCGVKIIAEPGRYVVASAFTLATSVVSRRDVMDDNGAQISAMYYVNDGVYGSFNCILHDHQEVVPQVLKTKNDGDIQYPSSIWGPTCDGLDQIVANVEMPVLKVGDWITWDNMGAYTLSACSTFNGFPRPCVHVVMPLHTWLYMEEYVDSSIINDSAKKQIEEKTQDDKQRSHCSYAEDNATVNNFLSNLALVDG